MEAWKLAQPFFKNTSQSLNFALWRDFYGFLYPNIPQLRLNCLKANFCVNKCILVLDWGKMGLTLLVAIFCRGLKEVRR